MDKALIRTAIMVGATLVGGCDEAPTLDPAAVARGKKIAATCATCHALTEESNRIGPHLVSVLGRKAGTVTGYAYSAAMKRHGQEWTPEHLAVFLENPLGVVPGTKMAISPLGPEQVSDVISYIQSLE